MKKTTGILIALWLMFLLHQSENLSAQNKLSLDLAYVRNMKQELNGLNISSFYHFTERIEGGLELNRFFPVNKKVGSESFQLSAWDLDLNFQYHLPVYKNLIIYPIIGISHTSEKEWSKTSNENYFVRLWSFNTGAGMQLELGRWSPLIEYLFTWGKINQQFLLAGISYELELGRKKKEK